MAFDPLALDRMALDQIAADRLGRTAASGSARKPIGASVLLAGIAAGFLLAVPVSAAAADPPHCFTSEEQRAAIASGKAVPLASVIRTLHRSPREVIKARLCQQPDRLTYMLTLLGRDGKVKRMTVDAANGAVVGER